MNLVPWGQTVTSSVTGAPIVSPVVNVRRVIDDGLASLYDMDGNSITNPVIGTVDGYVEFQVAPGRYEITGSGGGLFTEPHIWEAIGDQGIGYATREEVAGLDLPDWSVVACGGVEYVARAGVSGIPDMPGFLPCGEPTPVHFGGAAGVVSDRVAFQRLIAYLVGDFENSPRRTIDLMGREYTLDGPVYIGRFDFNQDGIFEINYWPINNVRFTNGRVVSDPNGDWGNPSSVVDEITPNQFYVGEVINQNFLAYSGENIFNVSNITFDYVEHDCGFVSGAVWIENTHRTICRANTYYNMGIGCAGVGTPQTVDGPRGYTPLNQQTIVDECRFEGNLRIDGISNWPGKEDFNGGEEIATAQPVNAGALLVNGAYASGGVFSSPDDRAYYVSIQHLYAETGEYADMTGINFTITGFKDAAMLQPQSEVMSGPRGGNKVRWSYSANKYAVITGISASATAVGDNTYVQICTDYKNMGVSIGTHDFYVTRNNFTALSYAWYIAGRAGEVTDNHPWSRRAVFTSNSRKITTLGNYFDFNDLEAGGSSHTINSNGFKIGNSNLYLIARTASDVGAGLNVVGNSWSEESKAVFEGDWETDPNLIEYTYISIPSAQTGLTFIPGFVETGRGLRVNSYFDGRMGGEFNGTLIMRGNVINGVADPLDADDAANKGYVDTRFTSGTVNAALNNLTVNGTVDVTNARIQNVATPTATADAATKGYVDAAVSTGGETDPVFNSVTVAGTTIGPTGYLTAGVGGEFNGYLTQNGNMEINGNLFMGSNYIYGVLTPTDNSQAANKGYVDGRFTSGTVNATFYSVSVGSTSINSSGDIIGSPDATLGATTATTFNVAGATFISGTGYITGGAGASFAGQVDHNANVALNGNRILSCTSITLPPQSSEPTGSNGTFANSDGTSSTNGFGAAGAGLYRKQSGTWAKV